MTALFEYGGKRIKNSRCLEMTTQTTKATGVCENAFSDYLFFDTPKVIAPTLIGSFWFKQPQILLSASDPNIYAKTVTTIFEIHGTMNISSTTVVPLLIRCVVETPQTDLSQPDVKGVAWKIRIDYGQASDMTGDFIVDGIFCTTELTSQELKVNEFHKLLFYLDYYGIYSNISLGGHITDYHWYMTVNNYWKKCLPKVTRTSDIIPLSAVVNKVSVLTDGMHYSNIASDAYGAQLADLYLDVSYYLKPEYMYGSKFKNPQNLGQFSPCYLGHQASDYVYHTWNHRNERGVLYMRIVEKDVDGTPTKKVINSVRNSGQPFTFTGTSAQHFTLRDDVFVTRSKQPLEL